MRRMDKKGNRDIRRILFQAGKCAFDRIASLCAAILLLVPLAVLIVVIKRHDRGKALYVQQRVGRNGQRFQVVKLRTMRTGADRLENMLTAEQLGKYRMEYKLEDDPRLIGWQRPGDGRRCIGGRLRSLSLDELPQIVWNICIKGNMSFVGPRPILEEELMEHYTEAQRKLLLSVKPGLTGYWQAYARNNANYASGQRQMMEMYYVQNASLLLDMKILLATVGAVFRKQGAF